MSHGRIGIIGQVSLFCAVLLCILVQSLIEDLPSSSVIACRWGCAELYQEQSNLKLVKELVDANDFKEAQKMLSAILETNPKCYTAYVYRSRIETKLSHFSEAANDLSVAQKLMPGDDEILGLYCNALYREGNLVDASKTFIRLNGRRSSGPVSWQAMRDFTGNVLYLMRRFWSESWHQKR